jgi:hypothetical protein
MTKNGRQTAEIKGELTGMSFQHRIGNTISIMLSIHDFRVLTFEKKCDVVTYNGHYLLHRFLGDCKVFLYNAEDFFIEVFYSTKYQKVLMINAFDQFSGIEPYLDGISLADLDMRPII